MKSVIYVGSYTSADRNGRGAGISVFWAESPAKPWEPLQTLATADNPSLLRTAPDGRTLYAVHGGRATISAFAIDPASGRITALNRQDSGGENPVDVGFVGAGRFLVTANYSSGTVAMLPIADNGELRAACQVITLARPGPHPGDATASMPHGVTVDRSGRFVSSPARDSTACSSSDSTRRDNCCRRRYQRRHAQPAADRDTPCSIPCCRSSTSWANSVRASSSLGGTPRTAAFTKCNWVDAAGGRSGSKCGGRNCHRS